MLRDGIYTEESSVRFFTRERMRRAIRRPSKGVLASMNQFSRVSSITLSTVALAAACMMVPATSATVSQGVVAASPELISTRSLADPGKAKAEQMINAALKGIAATKSLLGVTDLQKKGFTGKGIHIAIISYEPIRMSDVQRFTQRMSLPPLKLHIIPVDGGVPAQALKTPEGDAEVSLDIDAVHMVAPDATIDVYEVAQSDLLSIPLAAIAKRNQDQIVTISYGFPYFEVPPTEESAEQSWVTKLNQEGTTVFAASGDMAGTKTNVTLNLPSILPNVVGVGGSEVSVPAATKTPKQSNWPYSAGGYSEDFPEPFYQNVVNSMPAIPKAALSNRMVPDISGPADQKVATASGTIQGFPIQATTDQGTGAYFVQGTSLASPFEAGLFADLEQEIGHPLGDLNPLLYSAIGSSAYLPVTGKLATGGPYTGGSSYNLLTGLGVPNGKTMANAIQAYDVRLQAAMAADVASMYNDVTVVHQDEALAHKASVSYATGSGSSVAKTELMSAVNDMNQQYAKLKTDASTYVTLHGQDITYQPKAAPLTPAFIATLGQSIQMLTTKYDTQTKQGANSASS